MDYPDHSGHADAALGPSGSKVRVSTPQHGFSASGQPRPTPNSKYGPGIPHYSASSYETPQVPPGSQMRDANDGSAGTVDRNTSSHFGMGASAFDAHYAAAGKPSRAYPNAPPKSPVKSGQTSNERSKNFAMRFEDSVLSEDPTLLYDLKERLGKGSFGSVFRAVNRKTGDVVAIKIIPVADDESIEDVRREVSILQECENSHIVKYYGAYFQADNLWVRRDTKTKERLLSFAF